MKIQKAVVPTVGAKTHPQEKELCFQDTAAGEVLRSRAKWSLDLASCHTGDVCAHSQTHVDAVQRQAHAVQQIEEANMQALLGLLHQQHPTGWAHMAQAHLTGANQRMVVGTSMMLTFIHKSIDPDFLAEFDAAHKAE